MKAKDLMIGDWVVWATRPTKIDAIAEGGFSVHLKDEGWQSIDAIEPIKLTPEILEKNGFEIRGKRKYFLVPNDPSLAIKREPIIGANGNSFLIGHFWERNKEFRWFAETDYVHELQHALRLCGIEKEIEL